jgi:caa(3)-type oxidase subunit IV
MMDERREPTPAAYVGIWVAMIALVASEVAVTAAHPATGTLVATLLALALLEAALAVLYFMHLKYERRALLWWSVPLVLFTLVMLDHVWPDALRLLHLRLH